MKINDSNKLQRLTIIVGLVLIILTSFSIYILYDSDTFKNWPWFKFSVGMSFFTCLWVYTFWFFNLIEKEKKNYHAILFGLLVIPIDYLVLYPSLETLGLFSNKTAYYLIFILEVQHGIGFYIIEKGIMEYIKHLDYFGD